MTGRTTYGYVYGGKATFGTETRNLEGTAWSLGPCDEVRLRAAAVRDLSRTENIPLAGIEIAAFWFSEIIAEDAESREGTPGADPFRPRPGPDPFSPVPGDTGDI